MQSVIYRNKHLSIFIFGFSTAYRSNVWQLNFCTNCHEILLPFDSGYHHLFCLIAVVDISASHQACQDYGFYTFMFAWAYSEATPSLSCVTSISAFSVGVQCFNYIHWNHGLTMSGHVDMNTQQAHAHLIKTLQSHRAVTSQHKLRVIYVIYATEQTEDDSLDCVKPCKLKQRLHHHCLSLELLDNNTPSYELQRLLVSVRQQHRAVWVHSMMNCNQIILMSYVELT